MHAIDYIQSHRQLFILEKRCVFKTSPAAIGLAKPRLLYILFKAACSSCGVTASIITGSTLCSIAECMVAVVQVAAKGTFMYL